MTREEAMKALEFQSPFCRVIPSELGAQERMDAADNGRFNPLFVGSSLPSRDTEIVPEDQIWELFQSPFRRVISSNQTYKNPITGKKNDEFQSPFRRVIPSERLAKSWNMIILKKKRFNPLTIGSSLL